MSPTSQPQSNDVPAPVRMLCPHCNGPIDVARIIAPELAAQTEQHKREDMPPLAHFGRTFDGTLLRHVFPFGGACEPSEVQGEPKDTRDWVEALRQHWKVFVAFVASIVIICLALIWWGKPTPPGANDASPRVDTVESVRANAQDEDGLGRAAILDTLIQYNQAETEAAARLSITPLQPLLALDGPLAQRRSAQLAERERRNAPHRTMLVRWAVGDITITEKTATVVTQETWSNQEANAVAPEQATVRVTYTLRWDDTMRRWLIVDSSQVAL